MPEWDATIGEVTGMLRSVSLAILLLSSGAFPGCSGSGGGHGIDEADVHGDLAGADSVVDSIAIPDTVDLEDDNRSDLQDVRGEIPPDVSPVDVPDAEVGGADIPIEQRSGDDTLPTPAGLLVCDDVTLPCDFDNPGPNPWPYDSCTGNPFYHVCPGDSCVPQDATLQAFHAAWKKQAPDLLNLSPEEFAEHIFLNHVMEWPLGEGHAYRLFRIDFLMVMDWVIVRENHTAKIYTGEPLTEEQFEKALQENGSPKKKGLPVSVVSLDEVLEKFSACHPDMQGDFCHIFWHKASDPEALKLHLNGKADMDLGANSCLSLRLDLETGEGDCLEDVCYVE